MKKIKILVVTGVLLILTGLIIDCVSLHIENKKVAEDLKQKTQEHDDFMIRYDELVNKNIRLEYENQELWELYYSTVSTYDGEYEYYE